MKNKITLKNIKVNQSMSDETLCYSATIYLDGKKIAYTSNRGCGGSDSIDFIDKNSEKLWLDYAHNELGVTQDGWSAYERLGSECQEIAYLDMDAKKLKRMLKTKILIQGDKKGEWETFAFSKDFIKKWGMDRIISTYYQKLICGDLDIPSDRKMLNRMSFDKALQYFITL